MRQLVWVPVCAAIVATLLFVAQGGFGAGHGGLDLVIWILGLPGVLAGSWAPSFVARNDLLLLVWWPALLNVPLWVAIGTIASAVRRRTQPRFSESQKLNRAHAGAYLRSEGFILHAQHRATSGVLLSAAPVIQLPQEASVAELGNAVRQVLQAYKDHVPHPNDWSKSGQTFLKVAGYRSWRALEGSASYCTVDQTFEELVFTPMRNGGSRGDRKGFQPFEAEPVVMSCDAPDDQVGDALKRALKVAQGAPT